MLLGYLKVSDYTILHIRVIQKTKVIKAVMNMYTYTNTKWYVTGLHDFEADVIET